MNTVDAVSPRDALDIIFANRNRAYGAYPLRREYPRTMRRALGWGMVLIGFFIGLPQLLSFLSAALPEKEAYEGIYDPKPVAPIETPPPPVIKTPPPPAQATIAYKALLIKPDDEVIEETLLPDMTELQNTDAAIGATTQDGDPNAEPALVDPPEDIPDFIEEPRQVEDNTVYNNVGLQKPPTFPGGEHDLLEFLAKNIKYPPLARENNIQGNVALTFVIGKDGSVGDIELLKDIGGGCGKEALRVVGLMPHWSPGEANGQAVKVRFTLPIRFRLD